MSASESSVAYYPVPNHFEPSRYYRVDVKTGVTRTSTGTKVCTLSSEALRGLYVGLKEEAGPAWRLILRRCGQTWGTRLTRRFFAEIEGFYGESLEQMSMGRFTALLEEWFATSGWGRVRFDYSAIDHGLLQVVVQNDVFAEVLADVDEHGGVLMEGLLTALFSELVGRKMAAYQTESVASGAHDSRFLIGTATRLKPVLAWIEDRASHSEILDRLLKA